jgi:PIN domain nuclease of toxin-antitoxin system
VPRVLVLDTHVLVHDALAPGRLSRRAKRMLESEPLACSDISLWEIGMLIAKGRVTVAAETEQFLEDIIHARDIQVLPITPRIAALAQSQDFLQADPADRIIAATAIAHRAKLLSADDLLRRLTSVEVVW